MTINKEIKKYWEQSTPMSFVPEKLSYEEKRNFRYSLQDYMHDVFRFADFLGKSVLEIGCGAGIDSAEFARNGALW
jgi:2-polyprenyl-3-methyl-5-hydroxy-6-metoxy-1,4-benzoquinol methylase